MDATNISIQAALLLGVFGVLYVALVRPQQRKLHRRKRSQSINLPHSRS